MCVSTTPETKRCDNLTKSKSCVDLIFEGWQKEFDVSDFVRQEFGSLQNAKVWEVDF